jgi:hypothetical protein
LAAGSDCGSGIYESDLHLLVADDIIIIEGAGPRGAGLLCHQLAEAAFERALG